METDGRLDRRHSMGSENGTGKCLRRIEFYWLCEVCADKMTLAFDKATGVSVRPYTPARVLRPAAAAAA